ncbi:hypothetical protein FHETE_3637 [Fusarium heterosporum]|uniref:Uncharacterized protein n=1 Tax=Fusarium heterosporum TaxID=42747 RepID=A0A8H5TMA1_FUSHE|nr:hypothetical protein FHETE_3637 [Fusarium heterosporum]
MDDSNNHHPSHTEPNDSDLDTSDWAGTLNIWDFIHEYDLQYDHLPFSENAFEIKDMTSNRMDELLEASGINDQSSLDMLDMPESFDIEQILEQDPDIYGACEANDLPLEAPIIEPQMQPFSPETLALFLQPPPPSQEIIPSPDEVPIVTSQWLDRQVAIDDFNGSINFEGGNSAMGDGAPMAQGTSCTILRGQKPSNRRQDSELSRCAPCRFANIPMAQCKGSVGSTCSRCERLKSSVDKKLAQMQVQDWEQSSLVLLLSPTEHTVPLPKVIYFELIETQKLLVALRGEVELVTAHSEPAGFLESSFNGNVLWHIDDKANISQYSVTSSTIAINRLATTAARAAAQPDDIVAPAMDAVQLDTFIDQRRPAQATKDLADVDRETLTIAWRCAYWLTILLNWDANDIYVTRSGRHAMPLVDAKNLVLELAYSVAHRIQVLIKKLCHRVVKSINLVDDSLDPVTLCCALWIVFSATHKFEKRNFNAKSLKNLKKFLSSLRERSRAAFQSLDHYKRLMGASCCGRPRNNDGAFSKLIEDAKKQKALVNFAAEHQASDIFSMTLHNSVFDAGLRPQSYSEILESEILFHEDAALFLGYAEGRNLEAPRPFSRTQQQVYTQPVDDTVDCSAAENVPCSSSAKSGVLSRTLEDMSTSASPVTNSTSIASNKVFNPILDQTRGEKSEIEKRPLSQDEIPFSTQKVKRTRVCQ